MAKTSSPSSEKIVRDSKSGRLVTVYGAGALKGQLTIHQDVDLTKPIASQIIRDAKRSDGSSHAKP